MIFVALGHRRARHRAADVRRAVRRHADRRLVAAATWEFFTEFPSRRAGQAGILSAWVGTHAGDAGHRLFAVPLGVGAGVYLEEYAPKNWVTDIIEINITNLAGVPSIVYGLLALGLFVYEFGLGQSILTAGLDAGAADPAGRDRRHARGDPLDSRR